jgi:hypothetical protein
MSRSDYETGYYAELARQVAKNLAVDNGRKAKIVNSNADIFCAFDAGELAGMSGHEAAAEVLKKRGLRLNSGEDAVRALEIFDAGMSWGRADRRFAGTPGTFAADSGADMPAFLSKYLGG